MALAAWVPCAPPKPKNSEPSVSVASLRCTPPKNLPTTTRWSSCHGPADTGYRGLSLPMNQCSRHLQRALEDGRIDGETCARVTDIAKQIYYEDRIWPRSWLAARLGLDSDRLALIERILAENYVDLKRSDAELMLRTIRDLRNPLPGAQPSFSFNRTWLFNVLYNVDRRVRHDDTEVPLDSIAKVAALHQPDFWRPTLTPPTANW